MIGRLASQILTASTNTSVYMVPTAARYAVVDINILNTAGSAATANIALSNTSTPTAAEYIENGVGIPATGGVFLREKLYMSPGEYLVVYATQAVAVRISGIEYVD